MHGLSEANTPGKIERSFQSGQCTVNGRVLCSLVLTERDVVPDSVRGNSDSLVLAKIFDHVVDRVLQSAEALLFVDLVIGCETFR